MGLIDIFISNVFDIYPSPKFTAFFLENKSLDISKILNHDFLKVSLVFARLWKNIYKTYPTKKDFVTFTDTFKIIPEACNTTFDQPFFERFLNDVFHLKLGLIKLLDTSKILQDVHSYISQLKDSKFIEKELIEKWKYRFCSEGTQTTNLLMTFASIYKAYSPPLIYEYQINPVSNNYNENVEFNLQDDEFLNEHEKIQYTIYRDHHFILKLIDSIGVQFDTHIPDHVLNAILKASTSTDKYIIFINSQPDSKHDPSLSFNVPPYLQSMFPAIFSNYILISDKQHPTVKSLSVSRDRAIFYIHAHKPISNQQSPSITDTYDRVIVNSISNYQENKTLKYYILLDPTNIQSDAKKVDILCDKTTNEKFQKDIKEAGYTCTTDPNCQPKYLFDLTNSFDLLDYMDRGTIPFVQDNHPMIKNMVTGIKSKNPFDTLTDLDDVVLQNIKRNLKYINILKHPSLFEYAFKQHLELSCHSRNITSKNGILIYLSFIYRYFMKNIEKLTGLEDKNSRSTQYKVVLIDDRPSPLSVMSILFTLSNLNVMWSCKIYTTKKGQKYYEELLGDIVDVIVYEPLDVPKFHIDVYNNILKSADFWRSINAEKTLIIQNDGILLRPNIEPFMKFDYVGASWVDNVSNEYIKKHITEDLVGNGGFSLRTNELMVRICEQYTKEKTWLFFKNITQIPEDVYTIYCLKQLEKSIVNLPNFQQGVAFASEEVCNLASIGIHKIWSYHTHDVIEKYFNGVLN